METFGFDSEEPPPVRTRTLQPFAFSAFHLPRGQHSREVKRVQHHCQRAAWLAHISVLAKRGQASGIPLPGAPRVVVVDVDGHALYDCEC